MFWFEPPRVRVTLGGDSAIVNVGFDGGGFEGGLGFPVLLLLEPPPQEIMQKQKGKRKDPRLQRLVFIPTLSTENRV